MSVIVEEGPPEKNSSFSDSGSSADASNRLSGLISPRFLSASNPSGKAHFRWVSIECDECGLDEPGEGSSKDDDVDVIDIDSVISKKPKHESSVASIEVGERPKGKSSSRHGTRHHKKRKSCAETDFGDGFHVAVDKDASSPVESESAMPLCYPKDETNSSNTIQSDHHFDVSVGKPVDARRTASFGDQLDEPGPSRRRSGRMLQRASRMTPQEIKSVMSTINVGERSSPRGDRPSTPRSSLAMAKSRSCNGASQLSPLYMMTESASVSEGLLVNGSGYGDDDGKRSTNTLCHPQPETVPATPRTPSTSKDDKRSPGKDATSEKVRHGHNRFFSLSMLKPAKNGSGTPKKGSSSNPPSPMCGKKNPSSDSSSPDPRLTAMTLEEVVKDSELSALFMAYLEKMSAAEGLEFLIRLETLKKHEVIPGINTYSLHEEALIMYEFYIREGAQKELNLSSSTRDDIETKLTAPKAEQLKQPSLVFQEARIEVFNMLGTNLYSQWIASLH